MTTNFRALTVCTLIGLLATGCGTSQPDTSLFGKGRHTGTATLLRIDDGWRGDPDTREPYHLGQMNAPPRFVPVRFKDDIAKMDTPERVVTDQDDVTIALKSVFIRYFQESGVSSDLASLGGREKSPSGEIALVMSFSTGVDTKESVLVYASEGQTLGSYLALDDWPIIGPIKMTGDSLQFRIVMIEVDQIENEQLKESIRSLATLASTFQPGLATALSIATPIADFIVSLNSDDVVLDHRFALQRSRHATPLTRSPLLYGRYVLVLQEDRLRGDAPQRLAPTSVLPPAFAELRYDIHSDRLYKAYPYWPRVAADYSCAAPAAGVANFPTYVNGGVPVYEGKGPISWPKFEYVSVSDVKDELVDWTCLLDNYVNATVALDYRKERLGYVEPMLGEWDLYWSLDDALIAAFCESRRIAPLKKGGEKHKDSCSQKIPLDNKVISNDYPVVQYPEGYAVLAQYGVHTHIVLSVDRSLGGSTSVHDRFATYAEFLDNELANARNQNLITKVSEELTRAVQEKGERKAIFRQLAALGPDKKAAKLCLLYRKLERNEDPAANTPLISDVEFYNEVFHLTGQWHSTADQVFNALNAVLTGETVKSATIDSNAKECQLVA
jgi:hypothetical protein